MRAGRFVVGSGSNLSVVVFPSTESSVVSLAGDSPYINVKTYPFQPGGTIDHVGVLSAQHTVSRPPLVLLASGRAYTARNSHGDAMWGLLVNNECPSSSEHLWAVNDIAPDSYLHVPMWTHAMYDNPPPTAAIQLAATELPYERQGMDNPVRYTVGSSTTMIALSGGMPIHGGISELRSRPCTPGTYIPAGTGNWTYWTRSFDVRRGQNGNVLFLLKTRVLDCQANEGPGLVKLQLELDGDLVGSTGIQGFAYNETCHQRTLTASYLAMGLSAGRHTIQGRIDTTGLPGLAASGDLGLLYFGN